MHVLDTERVSQASARASRARREATIARRTALSAGVASPRKEMLGVHSTGRASSARSRMFRGEFPISYKNIYDVD